MGAKANMVWEQTCEGLNHEDATEVSRIWIEQTNGGPYAIFHVIDGDLIGNAEATSLDDAIRIVGDWLELAHAGLV